MTDIADIVLNCLPAGKTLRAFINEHGCTGFEYGPVQVQHDECCLTTPENADLWTVYMQIEGGEALAIHDVDADEHQDAHDTAALLAKTMADLAGVPVRYVEG